MYDSTHYLIRTKALQDHSALVYPKGDAITPVNPRVFRDPRLSDGDILLSKDSNIGEVAMVNGDGWARHMFSGGILRLRPVIDKFYLFAFLKHPLFKEQLCAMVPRGATIKHAKSLWLDCLVPFPTQKDSARVVEYASALMQAIVEKEAAIRARSDMIHDMIHVELTSQQRRRTFRFEQPTSKEIRTEGRLDAAIYDVEYKSKIWLVENYAHGYLTPSDDGFTVTPGPSLEIRILRTRIDTHEPRPGYYALILPTNISVYGTMNAIPFMGTAKKLPLLLKGDIVFGEAGFQKGRSIVLLEGLDNCTTNAHGLYARRTDGDIEKSIFFRCIFNWYRTMRLVDLMAVGGSGGHFSPEYFDYLRIPQFPDRVRQEIVKQYHSATSPPPGTATLDTFVEHHRKWNEGLGIWELDREMKNLQRTLHAVQGQIIEGNPVSVPL